MGEQRAIRERIGSNKSSIISFVIDNQLPITKKIVSLHSFNADNLKYVHNYASCYNKCRFGSTFEASFMVENGERTHDY